jgi:DNA-binding MarR family transcriptional regulator
MQLTNPFVAILQQWIEISMHRSMRDFICFARENGLSMSQLGALFHIHSEGSSGVTDLGDHLGVTSAASSQMLERLVQQGLILRKEDPNDRRVKRIILTEKGRKTIQAGIRARQGWLNDLADTLSDQEKESILLSLHILISKATDLEESVEN